MALTHREHGKGPAARRRLASSVLSVTAALLHGPVMPKLRTPRQWLQSAIELRSLAVVLTDQDAKLLMEELADECELLAQSTGEMMDIATGTL